MLSGTLEAGMLLWVANSSHCICVWQVQNVHLDILLLVVSFALVCAHFLAACKKAFCVKIAIAALTYGKCKISFVFREFVIFRFRFSYLRNFSVFTFLVPSHLRDAPIRASAFFICIVPPIPATALVSVSFLFFYYYYHPFFSLISFFKLIFFSPFARKVSVLIWYYHFCFVLIFFIWVSFLSPSFILSERSRGVAHTSFCLFYRSYTKKEENYECI